MIHNDTLWTGILESLCDRAANRVFKDDNQKFHPSVYATDELTEIERAMSLKEVILDTVKKEGREEGKIEVVRNLLITNRFTIGEVTNFANVSEDFVLNVKKSLK